MEEEGTTGGAVRLRKIPTATVIRSTERGTEAIVVSGAGADLRDPRKVDTEMKKIANIVHGTATRRGRKDIDVVPRTHEDDGNGIPI